MKKHQTILLAVLATAVLLLPNCGGGSSTPPSYTVTPGGDNVTVSPATPQSVTSGGTQAFEVTPDSGYALSSTVTGTCAVGSWNGSTYTTGAITGNCTVTFVATQTLACESDEREFSVTNSTSETIWVGITAGTISCLTDADCPTGAAGSCVGVSPPNAGNCGCAGGASMCGSISTCSTSNNNCYWNLPPLSQSQIKLAAGGSSTICFPAPTMDIQWSGNIFARTGCDSNGQNCQTGECGASSSGICPTGTGGNPPTALFEFTLSDQTDFTTTPNNDYYDISIINGVNVAISGGPVAGTYSPAADNPYSCTTPGSTSAQGSLLACNWTITPTVSAVDRSTWLNNVYPTSYAGATCPAGSTGPNSLGYCACTADSACGTGICGLAMNASSLQYTRVCGTHIGWWTADQLCGSSNNDGSLSDLINCAATVTNSDGSTSTYTNLLKCTGVQAQSCYTTGAAAYCCGCATSASAPYVLNWPTVLSPDFGGSDHGCYNNNTNWGTIAQPWLVYLKTACPTAYTYPFDDATSTFTCLGNATVGAPEYAITFMNTN